MFYQCADFSQEERVRGLTRNLRDSDKEESSNMYNVTIGQIYKRSEDWVRM